MKESKGQCDDKRDEHSVPCSSWLSFASTLPTLLRMFVQLRSCDCQCSPRFFRTTSSWMIAVLTTPDSPTRAGNLKADPDKACAYMPREDDPVRPVAPRTFIQNNRTVGASQYGREQCAQHQDMHQTAIVSLDTSRATRSISWDEFKRMLLGQVILGGHMFKQEVETPQHCKKHVPASGWRKSVRESRRTLEPQYLTQHHCCTSVRVLCEIRDLFDPVLRALGEVRDVSSGFSAHSVRCEQVLSFRAYSGSSAISCPTHLVTCLHRVFVVCEKPLSLP